MGTIKQWHEPATPYWQSKNDESKWKKPFFSIINVNCISTFIALSWCHFRLCWMETWYTILILCDGLLIGFAHFSTSSYWIQWKQKHRRQFEIKSPKSTIQMNCFWRAVIDKYDRSRVKWNQRLINAIDYNIPFDLKPFQSNHTINP